MSRHWQQQTGGDKLASRPVYFVEVCGFTFRFSSLAELQTALSFYRQKTHPSSRLPDPEWVRREARRDPRGYKESIARFIRAEHDVMQRWWERAPLYLQENGKRDRVIQALESALREFAPHRGRTGSP